MKFPLLGVESSLVGRERLDLQGMDVPFHEVAQRLINHSMPRHGALAAEGLRNYGEAPVAASRRPRTRVAGMLRAFVLQFQRQRGERLEALAHGALHRVHHGAGPCGGSAAGAGTFGGSSGRYLDSHIACATTKASIRP